MTLIGLVFLLFAASSVAVLMARSSRVVPRGVRHQYRCVGCLYDLSGLDLHAACPECGRQEPGWSVDRSHQIFRFDRWSLMSMSLGLAVAAALVPYGVWGVLATLSEPLSLPECDEWIGMPIGLYVMFALVSHGVPEARVVRPICVGFGVLGVVEGVLVLSDVWSSPGFDMLRFGGLCGWAVTVCLGVFAVPLGAAQFGMWVWSTRREASHGASADQSCESEGRDSDEHGHAP